MTRAHLDRRPEEVAAMFDRLADRYDLVNDVMTAGQDRLWRRAVARALRPYLPGGHGSVLDIAGGTGTSARAFASAGARCVACDFSLGMLRTGRRRLAARPVPASARGEVTFVAGDAFALPFRDESFDAVTNSFGLRNMADTAAALSEMLRVAKPGGGLVLCEFSHLRHPRAEAGYRWYLANVLPAVARMSSNPEAYAYLAESIDDWPAQQELAQRISDVGWTDVGWRNLSGGIVAVHTARRPGK
jgi:demethylmenaquinone methyltransferase/2-methoxy-6-polyprenyl-1,4-benzoquinol methylase